MTSVYISLKIRIWLLLNLTILIVVVSAYFYFPANQFNFLFENESNEVQYITTSLSANVNVALEEENFDAISSVMEEIRNDNRLEFIAIFQKDSIRTSSGNWEVTNTLFQIYPENTDINENFQSSYGLIVKRAFFKSSLMNGEIVVGFKTDSIIKNINNLKRTVLISGIIVFLIGSIVSYISSNSITHSLQQLIEAAKSVGSVDTPTTKAGGILLQRLGYCLTFTEIARSNIILLI